MKQTLTEVKVEELIEISASRLEKNSMGKVLYDTGTLLEVSVSKFELVNVTVDFTI